MELYIIAGPTGVGKTTFANKFLPKYANCQNFINADLIAKGMSPFSPEAAAVRAGKLVLSEIRFFCAAARRLRFRDNVVRAKVFEVESAPQEAGIQSAPFLSCGEGC
jgi:predicted ABC-type ATPase